MSILTVLAMVLAAAIISSAVVLVLGIIKAARYSEDD